MDFFLRLVDDLLHRGVRVFREALVVRRGVVHHLEVVFAPLGQGLVGPADDFLIRAVFIFDLALVRLADHVQPLVLGVAEVLFRLLDALDDAGVGEVVGTIGHQCRHQTVDGQTQRPKTQCREPGRHRRSPHCRRESAEGRYAGQQDRNQRLDRRADGVCATNKPQEVVDRLHNGSAQVRRQEGLELVHLRQRFLRVALDEQLVLLVERRHGHFAEVLQGFRHVLAVVVRLAQGTADGPHVGDQLGKGRHVLVRAVAELQQRPFQPQGGDHLRAGLEAQFVQFLFQVL